MRVLAEDAVEVEPEQDDGGADEGSADVAGERGVEKDGGSGDEERREDGISPDAIGSRAIGLALAIDEDRGRRDHVEEPLRKNSQLK